MQEYRYQKNLPVECECDILVCGSGPAGIAAAVSAARENMHVVMLERFGVIGGNLTLGNVSPLMGDVALGTIRDELATLLCAKDSGTAFDVEHAKNVLTHYVAESGVTVRLECTVVDALVEDGVIKGVVVTTPTGPACFMAKRIIDATGDGYVSAMAGEQMMCGRDEDGLVQPVSILYTIDGIDPDCTLVCRHEEDDTVLSDGRRYLSLCRQAAEDGRLPSNVTIVRLYPTGFPGERLVNATQENGIHPWLPGELDQAQVELRRQVDKVNHFLRTEVPGFSKIRTRTSAAAIGVRESRRVCGRYVIKSKDLERGARFSDVVVHGACFCFDIHNPVGGGQAETDARPHDAQPYDIPVRCLQPLLTDHLVLCGRCISGTHRAHASYRVMSIAMATGQAAAMIAVSSMLDGKSVRAVNVADVQARLEKAGCQLFTP